MCYKYGHLVVKRIVKRLIVVNILKIFKKRRLHYLINKTGILRIT
jgi:hypothetical protein